MPSTGAPETGPRFLCEKVETAIWIGVVPRGVAVLGAVEFVRSRSFVKARFGDIKSGLPILFLALLVFIADSIAVVSFHFYFLASIWQFSLAVPFMVFIFPEERIRKEQSLGALVVQPKSASCEPGPAPALFTRAATLTVEAAGAAMLMIFMVPIAAGGFLLFRFFGIGSVYAWRRSGPPVRFSLG